MNVAKIYTVLTYSVPTKLATLVKSFEIVGVSLTSRISELNTIAGLSIEPPLVGVVSTSPNGLRHFAYGF